MRANFKNTETGELFHVTTHSTRYCEVRKRHINTDVLGNEIVDPETGQELESIAFDDRTDEECTVIATKSSVVPDMSRGVRDKALKHFRERANKHTRGKEGGQERLRSIEREIDSINRSGKKDIKK
tara:strand:- start:26391 stop:26768 length:378 start_codon:yes stop_codon:yes gene_type:complete